MPEPASNHRPSPPLALRPEQELAFAERCLGLDPKNYHTWAHRQALVGAWGGGLWGAELAYAARQLDADPRNNSAWVQRAWVLRTAPEGAAGAGAAAEAYAR